MRKPTQIFGVPQQSEITLKLKLQVAIRQDGEDWIANCVPLDIATQESSRDGAIEAIKEAIDAWFESCIERNMLDEALQEAGFLKASTLKSPPEDASFVQVSCVPKEENQTINEVESRYVEVTVPAYTAAARTLESYAIC